MDTTNGLKVEYSVDYCVADILDAYKASYWWAKYRVAYVTCGFLFLVFGFAVHSELVMISAAGMIACFIYLLVRIPDMAKKTLASPSFAAGQQVCLDESGLSVHAAASSGVVNWTQFVNFKETKDTILLYPTPYTFVIVPKRCLSPTQLNAAEQLISCNVQKSKQSVPKLVVIAFVGIAVGTFLISFFMALKH